MWTKITRKKYGREKLRYASDTTDEEWALIEPLLPLPAKGRGRPRTTDLRSVVDALFYIAQSGCQWRMLPKNFPPYTTVQRCFYPWRDGGLLLLRQISHVLVMQAREHEGREAESDGEGVIDSQSVKTTEMGGPRGFDAGKESEGAQAPHPHRHNRLAGGGDRARGERSGSRWRSYPVGLHPPSACIHGCAMSSPMPPTPVISSLLHSSRIGRWTIEIVRRMEAIQRLPTPQATLGRRGEHWRGSTAIRRLAKDFEASVESALAWLLIASIKLLTRRLARA